MNGSISKAPLEIRMLGFANLQKCREKSDNRGHGLAIRNHCDGQCGAVYAEAMLKLLPARQIAPLPDRQVGKRHAAQADALHAQDLQARFFAEKSNQTRV